MSAKTWRMPALLAAGLMTSWAVGGPGEEPQSKEASLGALRQEVEALRTEVAALRSRVDALETQQQTANYVMPAAVPGLLPLTTMIPSQDSPSWLPRRHAQGEINGMPFYTIPLSNRGSGTSPQ